MKAKICDIKRFAVHDGDGIRTTVFFKGCPLKCIWCHNPESISSSPEIAYFEGKCINCGECVKVCPNFAHRIVDGKHIFDRDLCAGCGECEKVCLGSAITFYGKEYTVDELLPLLLEDRDFYENGGGVTLSGGECLELTQAPSFAPQFRFKHESLTVKEYIKAIVEEGVAHHVCLVYGDCRDDLRMYAKYAGLKTVEI